MQNQVRGRSRKDRLVLLEEEQKQESPSYFQWREQTIRTQAYRPTPQAQAKPNPILRLFRRFG